MNIIYKGTTIEYKGMSEKVYDEEHYLKDLLFLLEGGEITIRYINEDKKFELRLKRIGEYRDLVRPFFQLLRSEPDDFLDFIRTKSPLRALIAINFPEFLLHFKK